MRTRTFSSSAAERIKRRVPSVRRPMRESNEAYLQFVGRGEKACAIDLQFSILATQPKLDGEEIALQDYNIVE